MHTADNQQSNLGKYTMMLLGTYVSEKTCGGLGYSSEIEHLSRMHKVIYSIKNKNICWGPSDILYSWRSCLEAKLALFS